MSSPSPGALPVVGLPMNLAFPGGRGLVIPQVGSAWSASLPWLARLDRPHHRSAVALSSSSLIVRHVLGSRSHRATLMPMAPFMTAGALLAVMAVR